MPDSTTPADTRLAERFRNFMRICHFGKYYPPAPGGMETHVRELARGQAALGHDVTVICVNHASATGSDATWDVLARTNTVFDLDGPIRVIRVGRHASLARFDICPGFRSALRSVCRDGVDLIHLHTPNPAGLMALSAWGGETPIIVTHHSDVIRQRVLALGIRPFERFVYRRARRILTDSPPYAAGSRQLRPFLDKVEPLPLGIDLEPYLNPSPTAQMHERRIRTETGEPLWLCVGRLVYYKGFDVAIQALTRVPGRLLIIGTGMLENKLKRLAVKFDVADRVTFRGLAPPEELIGAYRAATAFWFPSVARSEGYGLVQVEAMASGCPVINTDIPDSGVSWVSRHEETGLTVPVNDPVALAGAADRLLHEDGLRQRLSRGARDRTSELFAATTMGHASLAIYRAALCLT